MRKVIESTLVSIDGVIGDPPVWAGEYFDKEAERAALEQLVASDAMLMGRRTYEMFAAMSLTGTRTRRAARPATRLPSPMRYKSTSAPAGWCWWRTTLPARRPLTG